MSAADLIGWDRLRHGGLLLDAPRLRRIADHAPDELGAYHQRELRRLAAAVLDGSANVPEFVMSVLGDVCGFKPGAGSWQRGPQVGPEWGRRTVTGETIKPRQLWRGPNDATLPVFFDAEARLGIGRGRKAASQVVQWLRAGSERLALLTNGRQWRLIFAGLDFDAWCEWDVDLWFEEGELSPQVHALRTLLSPKCWTPPTKDASAPLLQAILDSRKGQADLSAILGERVREAVELLVQAHGEVLKEQCASVDPAEIYRAAVRVVMRMVVVLFAESRELLPRDNALYHGAYGLTGLLDELEKAAARGGNRLVRSWNAWPRVLALFRLVHQGSHHPSLPVPAYGGELFAPGEPNAIDGLSRSLAVFETAAFERELLSDRDVHRMLERITRTKVKVRQGRASIWVPTPVDFSDLSSEYIGILYEGLLDFELKTAPPGDPVVFLAVGNQPALPLSRLEAMDDNALAGLLEKMKDTSKGDAEGEEAGEAAEPAAEEEPADEETPNGEDEDVAATSEVEEEPEVEAGDERHTTRTRAETWARRAVEVGKLAKRPRGTLTPEKRLVYEDIIARKARQLVVRVILPGEWYLVRWGGTRKGAGTFYTRPGLAVPTVQRTLRPLAYIPPTAESGAADLNAPPSAWTPKAPEQILNLRVCDPACGSGTFPVAALRFLTEALFAALHRHGRVSADGERSVVQLLEGPIAPGGGAGERLGQELLPCRPDDALFEPRLKAILRRYVVERCIYGVDLDPLAVELCRLALWIETMDRTLPFSFLDHKVKCGNSLVGAWFDQFQHYPVMAWKNREGGDKNHNNGVHFEKEARTKAIKEFVKTVLARDLTDALTGQRRIGAPLAPSPQRVHADLLATLSRLHELPVQDSAEKARLYRDELLNSTGYVGLKAAMDQWCACWFWPTDDIDQAPLPSTFLNPLGQTLTVSQRVASEIRFFHWELEFPDVFAAAASGFDAILGNPPWDAAKPNSKEFFSNVDPLYRSYGKQEALEYQTQYFSSPQVERHWLDYNAGFRAQSNWVGAASNAFGDPKKSDAAGDRFTISRGKQNDGLHAVWRERRAASRGFADEEHPFRHQGSGDLNLYKAFVEQAHALLRNGGRLGFIVPSGFYSDHGTGALRRLSLDHCGLEWIFGFENRLQIFDIASSSKFNPIIIEKGGKTEAICTAFMRRKLEDWEHAEALATPYTRAQVERFSPRSKAILEIQSPRDLEILETIYANSVLLGDDGPDGWGIKYAREFDMTNDSKLFPPRSKWEADGYRPDEYSRWVQAAWQKRTANGPAPLDKPRASLPPGIVLSRDGACWCSEDDLRAVAYPMYQGRMIWQFRSSALGHVSGTGMGAKWEPIEPSQAVIQPQYLIGQDDWSPSAAGEDAERLFYRYVTKAVNERTIVAAICPRLPAAHTIGILEVSSSYWGDALALMSVLNSFVFDYVARLRFSGGMGVGALDPSKLWEHPILPKARVRYRIAQAAQRLSATDRNLATLLIRSLGGETGWRHPALSPAERLRLRVTLDAIVAVLFSVTSKDMSFVLRDCDHPTGIIGHAQFSRNLDQKGFWRVDKGKDPELRHSVLTLVALHDLEDQIDACGGDRERGIAAFLEQNEGEGWILPDSLRLADYGLGHDDRAKHPQPVASRLGPRFFDWQLAQTAEESWRECHLHARNLLGEAGYRQLLAGAAGSSNDDSGIASQPVQPAGRGAEAQGNLFDRG